MFYAPGGRVVDHGDLSVDSMKAQDHDARSRSSMCYDSSAGGSSESSEM